MSKCPICGNKVKIEKVGYSAGMDGRYYDQLISCDKCHLLNVEYSADCFYRRDYYETAQTALDAFDKQCSKNKDNLMI